MKLIDVYWTPSFNRIRVLCDCGLLIDHPTRVSLVQCQRCGRAELWHEVYPKEDTGPWSEPVMENTLTAG